MTPPRIFCAIDTPDLQQALALVQKLSSLPLGIKLGLEFFVAQGIAGVKAIRSIAGADVEIFLDLKLHDIPNTVAGAVRAAMQAQPDFITLHTGGGLVMLQAAQQAAAETAKKTGLRQPKLLGVTVLTTLDDADLTAVGQATPAAAQVERLALLAEKAGLAGVVCSPHEISILRAAVGADFLLVVPGIRPQSAASDDQKRIMTPEKAASLGASYLVIGRPITQAHDPEAIARALLAEAV